MTIEPFLSVILGVWLIILGVSVTSANIVEDAQVAAPVSLEA